MLFPLIVIVDVLMLGVVDVILCRGLETVDPLFKFFVFGTFPLEPISSSMMPPPLDAFLVNSIVSLVLFIAVVSWFITLLVMLWISDLFRLSLTGIN